MRDITNREIKVGDLIGYPCRKQSKAWLQVMRVDQVLPDRLGGFLPTGRHAQIWGRTLQHLAIIRGATLEAAASRRQALAAAN